MTTERVMTKSEAEKLLKNIVKFSRSEKELRSLMNENGLDGDGAVIFDHKAEHTNLFQCHVMLHAPDGNVISI